MFWVQANQIPNTADCLITAAPHTACSKTFIIVSISCSFLINWYCFSYLNISESSLLKRWDFFPPAPSHWLTRVLLPSSHPPGGDGLLWDRPSTSSDGPMAIWPLCSPHIQSNKKRAEEELCSDAFWELKCFGCCRSESFWWFFFFTTLHVTFWGGGLLSALLTWCVLVPKKGKHDELPSFPSSFFFLFKSSLFCSFGFVNEAVCISKWCTVKYSHWDIFISIFYLNVCDKRFWCNQ